MFVIGALTACSNDSGDVTIEHTHDACAPLALVADAPTSVQTTGIQNAESLWRDRGAPAIGRRAGTTLEVRFQDAAGAFHGLYDDAQPMIYINRGIDDEDVLAIVIAHELGHAYGLLHVTDRPSLMNPGNLSIKPTAEDQRALEALWGSCQ